MTNKIKSPFIVLSLVTAVIALGLGLTSFGRSWPYTRRAFEILLVVWGVASQSILEGEMKRTEDEAHRRLLFQERCANIFAMISLFVLSRVL